MKYKQKVLSHGLSLLTATAALIGAAGPLQAQDKKPNILFIMSDDIGWMQPSCYHQGLMVGETPNIDRIAKEGARFMTYYAEQSCTAGRNAFITGMHPLRTGMIPPQLPGSPKRDPFEQAVGEVQKTATSIGGSLGSPSTVYCYDWNILPIGQLLWLKELETYIKFPPLQSPESYNLTQVYEQVKQEAARQQSD
jgi:hypothetical protein